MSASAAENMQGVATAARVLLGRDRELAELYAFVEGIEGRGGALVVRGEAGIGKSALLAAARERGLQRGVRVVSTTGALSEAQLAFAGLHQLLLPLLGRLDLLPEPQRRALETAFEIAEGDAPDLFLIGLATLGLVAERAAETPLLFVVDDAHWLDRPSSEVLAFVARRVESDPAVILFGVREGLPSAFDDADLPELTLTGLDPDASNALLDLGGTTLPVDLRRRILEEAAGNPLALACRERIGGNHRRRPARTADGADRATRRPSPRCSRTPGSPRSTSATWTQAARCNRSTPRSPGST